MGDSAEMDQSTSVSSLRARFEQMKTSQPATPSPPTISPKPSRLSQDPPPQAPPPSSEGSREVTRAFEMAEQRQDDEEAVVEMQGSEPEERLELMADLERQAIPPARPPKPSAPIRPPAITIAAPFPSAAFSNTPELPAPPTPRALPPPPRTGLIDAAQPDSAPPTPTASRPSISQTPSLRRPAPPPPLRPRPPSSVSFVDDSPLTAVPALPNSQPQVLSPPLCPAPPALSVRSLASRFNDPSPFFRSASPASSMGRSNSSSASDCERENLSEDEESVATPEDEDGRSSSAGSLYSSSPEGSVQLKARPVIPPRPALFQSSQPLASPRGVVPPPLPRRTSTTSIHSSNGFSTTRSTSPVSISPTDARSSASTPAPSGSFAPPTLLSPPPRRNSVPTGAPPALPARKTSIHTPSVPPRTSSAPSPSPAATPTSASLPYIPPPPPTRTAPSSGSITPRRPDFGNPAGEDGSSDEDEEDNILARSQEFPDSTFANRRPPVLRNRRPVQTTHGLSAFAVRGHLVVTAHHRLHFWNPSASSASSDLVIANDQQKFLAVEFRAADETTPDDDGRLLWCGTKDGTLYEVDTEHRVVVQLRQKLHVGAVNWIFRVGRAMVTIDDMGKVLYWGTSRAPDGSERAPELSAGPHKAQRMTGEKQTWAAMIGDELWASSGPTTKPGSSAVLMRSPQIRVYDPSSAKEGAFSVLPRPVVTPESAGHIGAVTCHAIVPHQDHLVYLGHDNGYISVWDRASYAYLLVQRISPYSISALCGVRKYLWAGFRTGVVQVLDVSSEPWVVNKAWKAHKDPVIRLTVDPASLWKDETLQVASASHNEVCLWDGFLRDDWLDSELHLRQPDYCTFRTIRTLSVSWNIDSCRPSDLHGSTENLEFLQQAITSAGTPEIISFGFQEAIDLENKKLTAKSMLMGKKKTEQKLSDGLSSAYRQWHDKLVQAVRLAMPADSPYTVVHVGDLVGLLSCIFVKNSEMHRLRDIALITVKTGLGGRHGNKGAILSRFVFDDSSICFINCHLAAGQSHRRQRDRDLAQILEEKANFSELGSSSPGAYAPGSSGTMVFDHELTILSGDLNYRIDARRDVVVSAVASGNSESLLQHDQLLQNLATNQTFRLRSFKEPAIHFPPTYKYDPGTDQYDSSAKKRIPAWCDRVLYRADRADKVTPLQYRRWEVNVSDHRPISAAFDLRIKSVVPEKRSAVWAEIEASWFAVEGSILQEMREYYAGK
ncbi:hypothetical protein JCM11641_007746 [Rhodosporidiobolus odoratus]